MATVDPPNVATDTRWQRVTAGLAQLSRQSGHPYRIGVTFFPLIPSGPGSGPACSTVYYGAPSVPMHFFPSTRGPDAMAVQIPESESPTGPAFDATVGYMRQWAMTSHAPDLLARTPPSIVLVTDGPPTACGSTVEGVAVAAAAAFQGTPRMRTYVLAVGQEARGLDPIASGGGTARAISSGNGDLHEAFEKIARSRLICDIPFEPTFIGNPDVHRVEAVS
jgi:hypothetical protein